MRSLFRLQARPGVYFKADPNDADDDDNNDLVVGGGGGGRPINDPAITMAKYGASPERMASHIHQLEADNYEAREKNRILRRKLAASQLPEGAVVLTAEQAAHYQAYVAIGDVATVQNIVVERDTLKAEIETTKKEVVFGSIASDMGYNPEVFKDLSHRLGDVSYVQRDGLSAEGKPIKLWMARHKNDTGAEVEVEVDQLLTQRFPAYAVALKPVGQTNGTTDKPAGGMPFPGQPPVVGRQNEADPASSYLAAAYKNVMPSEQV